MFHIEHLSAKSKDPYPPAAGQIKIKRQLVFVSVRKTEKGTVVRGNERKICKEKEKKTDM